MSLPFSDHCEPLVDGPKDIEQLRCSLEDLLNKEHLKYIEIRPASARFEGEQGFGKAKAFWFHKIDLRPSQDELFRSFHKGLRAKKGSPCQA